ncbi:MAG: sigma-70 family RNA polymerase sigma factor [Paludisphaera borealis]|uniref:RNA polymerase sigma factor n=1 Tax=Paludisphaera borealis TaxID=1387353 RepID=UPI0028475BAE|nr:sigma-70 family RNA polymerase sigma factor [Paludisphaera borealis]MDR3617883.1 sigma-70 family RNA polymerase sigma factor [Paludisphaera borealis]
MDQDRRDLERELLVLRCQRGERSAFDELIRSWEQRLFFYVRRLVANEEDAWQVLQDVWLQVVRGVHALRDPQRLPVWLYAVARNNAMSHHRKAYARDRVLDATATVATRVDDQARVEVADFVHHGLALLGEGDREILTLFFLRDLSVNDVAEVLGIPPGTVKSRLHKAKKSLRDVLEREGAHDE